MITNKLGVRKTCPTTWLNCDGQMHILTWKCEKSALLTLSELPHGSDWVPTQTNSAPLGLFTESMPPSINVWLNQTELNPRGKQFFSRTGINPYSRPYPTHEVGNFSTTCNNRFSLHAHSCWHMLMRSCACARVSQKNLAVRSSVQLGFKDTGYQDIRIPDTRSFSAWTSWYLSQCLLCGKVLRTPDKLLHRFLVS